MPGPEAIKPKAPPAIVLPMQQTLLQEQWNNLGIVDTRSLHLPTQRELFNDVSTRMAEVPARVSLNGIEYELFTSSNDIRQIQTAQGTVDIDGIKVSRSDPHEGRAPIREEVMAVMTVLNTLYGATKMIAPSRYTILRHENGRLTIQTGLSINRDGQQFSPADSLASISAEYTPKEGEKFGTINYISNTFDPSDELKVGIYEPKRSFNAGVSLALGKIQTQDGTVVAFWPHYWTGMAAQETDYLQSIIPDFYLNGVASLSVRPMDQIGLDIIYDNGSLIHADITGYYGSEVTQIEASDYKGNARIRTTR